MKKNIFTFVLLAILYVFTTSFMVEMTHEKVAQTQNNQHLGELAALSLAAFGGFRLWRHYRRRHFGAGMGCLGVLGVIALVILGLILLPILLVAVVIALIARLFGFRFRSRYRDRDWRRDRHRRRRRGYQ